MADEKQSKESKKVTEKRVAPVGKLRGVAFKNEVVADNIR